MSQRSLQHRQPEETSQVTVAFSHPWKGWVHLALLVTERHQNLIVNCSELFEPFSGMNRWLHDIADGILPAAFKIDEEGRMKRFVVERANSRIRDAEEEGSVRHVEFRVEGKTAGEAGELVETCFIRCRCDRVQLLQAFLNALEEWLTAKYDPDAFSYMGSLPVSGFHDVLEMDTLRSKVEGLRT